MPKGQPRNTSNEARRNIDTQLRPGIDYDVPELPVPERVADVLANDGFEIEEIAKIGNDRVRIVLKRI